MKRKIVAILLILVLLQGVSYSVFAVGQEDLDKIQDKMEDKKDEKTQVDNELSAELKEINKLDTEISTSEDEIKNLEGQIDSLETSINEKQTEIEKKQKEFDANQKLLDERLVAMYEAGDTSYLDVLFASSDVVEFISNYYSLSQLVQCDTELLESISNEKKEIETAKQELESQKTQLDQAKGQKEIANANLKTKRSERQTKANSLSSSQKELEKEISDYNSQIREVENAIKKAMEEALKRAEEEEKNNAGSGSGSGSTGGTGSNFDGTFGWPLDYSPRRVTSKMYYRTYNGVTRWHKGIDIGTNAEIGKKVVSAADGTVILSSYQSGTSSNAGYGNYIIIYHGNGYATCYAHMSQKIVSEGQRVSQGQLIGYSGNTGGVAPHLHFEIRKATSIGNFFGQNNWLDPLDYMPGGYTIVS